MNIVLFILTGIAGIIALLLIIALFVQKEYTIQRDIIIKKPREKVFGYIKYLKNQDYYSKWVMADPNMKKDLRGTDGTVGFIYGWNGNREVGEGEQELKKIKENESIEMELRFIRPFAGVATAYMITDSVSSEETKVTWGMRGVSKYPMNLMNLFTGKILGSHLEISLNTLKGILEK